MNYHPDERVVSIANDSTIVYKLLEEMAKFTSFITFTGIGIKVIRFSGAWWIHSCQNLAPNVFKNFIKTDSKTVYRRIDSNVTGHSKWLKETNRVPRRLAYPPHSSYKYTSKWKHELLYWSPWLMCNMVPARTRCSINTVSS